MKDITSTFEKKINSAYQPTAYLLTQEQVREKVLINLSASELFIIRQN